MNKNSQKTSIPDKTGRTGRARAKAFHAQPGPTGRAGPGFLRAGPGRAGGPAREFASMKINMYEAYLESGPIRAGT